MPAVKFSRKQPSLKDMKTAKIHVLKTVLFLVHQTKLRPDCHAKKSDTKFPLLF